MFLKCSPASSVAYLSGSAGVESLNMSKSPSVGRADRSALNLSAVMFGPTQYRVFAIALPMFGMLTACHLRYKAEPRELAEKSDRPRYQLDAIISSPRGESALGDWLGLHGVPRGLNGTVSLNRVPHSYEFTVAQAYGPEGYRFPLQIHDQIWVSERDPRIDKLMDKLKSESGFMESAGTERWWKRGFKDLELLEHSPESTGRLYSRWGGWQSCLHPGRGAGEMETLLRWCRFAQPPATGNHPSGKKNPRPRESESPDCHLLVSLWEASVAR